MALPHGQHGLTGRGQHGPLGLGRGGRVPAAESEHGEGSIRREEHRHPDERNDHGQRGECPIGSPVGGIEGVLDRDLHGSKNNIQQTEVAQPKEATALEQREPFNRGHRTDLVEAGPAGRKNANPAMRYFFPPKSFASSSFIFPPIAR